MKTLIIFLAASTAALIFLPSCTVSKTMSLNSVELTNQLRPGMSYDEVVGILGNPKSSQMSDGQWIARWNLQEMWKGYVPYDFVFDPQNQTLISWSENTKAFEEKQQQMKVMADALEESSNQAAASSGNAGAAAGIQNNPELMRSFAGNYYSFSSAGYGYSGGSERKVMLCPDGRYFSASESGYSGGAGTSGAWGTASQGGGDGTWVISGDMNNGTLILTTRGGQSTTYKYSRCGNDCVYFGNNKFALAGPPDCR